MRGVSSSVGCLGSNFDPSGCISSIFTKMKKSNIRAFLKFRHRLGLRFPYQTRTEKFQIWRKRLQVKLKIWISQLSSNGLVCYFFFQSDLCSPRAFGVHLSFKKHERQSLFFLALKSWILFGWLACLTTKTVCAWFWI